MKRLLSILLVLLMITGCTGGNKPPKDTTVDYTKYEGKDYLQALKDFKVQDKNGGDTDDEKFDEFLDRLFVDEMSQSYTTVHFNVINYRNYGITKPEVKFGDVKTDYSEDVERYRNQLIELESFDYAKLSKRQQYDWDIYRYSLLETLADMYYPQYSFLFSGNVDVLSNTVTVLSDFPLYDQESVDDYMLLLADVDRYLDDCLAFTKWQADQGIYMVNMSIDDSLDYIDGFTAKSDDNALLITFKNNMDKTDFLTEEQKADYLARAEVIVKEEVIPAFLKVADEISNYYDKANKEDMPLVKMNPDYAEVVYMLKGSTNKTVEEIYNDVLAAWNSALKKYQYNYGKAGDKYDAMYAEAVYPFTLTPYETLEYLKNNLSVMYPALESVDYEVEMIDESAANDTTAAYYWQAPIDDVNQNVIRVNPKTSGDPVNDYTTLAHEGFPGHLYQQVSFLSTKPMNYRSVIGFIGYTEGWAVLAQTDAVTFAVDDEALAQMLGFDNNYYFLAYSLFDIGINYLGWTVKDFAKNLQTLGFNASAADYMYEFFIDMPGVYCSYGIGYTEHMALRDKAIKEMGDKFSYVDYHRVVINNGPVPFPILEYDVNNYINGK